VTKRDRELHQILSQIGEPANAKLVEIRKTNGGHVRASFDRGGPMFISPSDVRAIKNTAATARRVSR
jgi:hypothetical protein